MENLHIYTRGFSYITEILFFQFLCKDGKVSNSTCAGKLGPGLLECALSELLLVFLLSIHEEGFSV